MSNLIKLIKPPDYVSLVNILFGMTGLFLAILGEFSLATVCILLAAVADGMDGYVARKTSSGPLGEHIDSLADTVSFGVLPAVLIYSISGSAIAAVVAVFYVLCGVLRLARYNAFPSKTPGYSGIPITGAAVFLAGLALFLEKIQYTASPFDFLKILMPYESAILLVFMLLLSFVMVSTIPYVKVTKSRTFLILIGIFTLAVLSAFLTNAFSFLFPGILFILLLVYLVSPAFIRRGKSI
ncbi:CDP-diacylglycerol--serine O-phosphatidyltransferase [Methanolapillus millepedarum]|uniref:CDP-diacylglycerol--serine O-phosphatidyltransferase n=1 Tax=Methanolapillus millepedarum TaxID=3028296 RepID=UPI0030B88C9E